MIAPSIIGACRSAGVVLFLSNGGVSARGNREAMGKLGPALKQQRAAVIEYLTEHQAKPLAPWQADLVREFVEVDGLTLDEAEALALLSVRPLPAGDWLTLIVELDQCIEQYCAAVGVSGDDKAAIMATRCVQSLASIPGALAWFRGELAGMAERAPPATPPAREGNYEGRASAKAARARLHQPITKGMQL